MPYQAVLASGPGGTSAGQRQPCCCRTRPGRRRKDPGHVVRQPGENYRAFAQDALGRSAVPQIKGRSLCARARVVVVVPGHCVRLRHCDGAGQLPVADLYGQLRDRRDRGDLQRRSAGDLGLGRILFAEVRE